MKLLNRGLNFAIPPPSFPLEDIITDIETGIYFLPNTQKQDIRAAVKPEIARVKILPMATNDNYRRTIKSLRDKKVYYCKADKGNSVVILDRSDYDQRMLDAIADGPYTEIPNPIKTMVSNIKSAIRSHENTFDKG